MTIEARIAANREIAELEARLIDAKRRELRNYLSMARTAIQPIYGNALPDDEASKLEVMQTLASMNYGQNGYFFVFDYDGTNLVAPRQTALINRNWSGLTDARGTPITDRWIEIARQQGAGHHTHLWIKPATGREVAALSYVIGLQDWRWAVGTAVFIDDILDGVAQARAEVEALVRRRFVYVGAITLAALLVVFGSMLALNIHERRLADAKLRQLTQRIVDTQEEERGRVARELHDSISQMLVAVRYALELARRRLSLGDAGAADSLDKGISHLNGAIQEVRRISRDLRPGVLDDLGLGPAIKALTEDMARRIGVTVDFKTVVFRNRLTQDAKIALYRIAQEALTNIERHADADTVTVRVFGHKGGATLRIADNGRGIPRSREGDTGLGLRNMHERMDHIGGSLRILPGTDGGTVIEAQVPLSQMLPPDETKRRTA